MDVDPRANTVAFQLNTGADEIVVGRAPTLAEDGVRQAWEGVRREHDIHTGNVVALHAEWEPSPTDVAFIEAAFPNAAVTFNFPRPTPDGWEKALAAAQAAMPKAADEQHPPAGNQQATAEGHQDASQVQANPGSSQLDSSGNRYDANDTPLGTVSLGQHADDRHPGTGGSHHDGGSRQNTGSLPEDNGDNQQGTGARRDAGTSQQDTAGDLRDSDGGQQNIAGGRHGAGSQQGTGGSQQGGNGQLLPVLWSESSPQVGMLEAVPHWPVAAGRLHLALAVVAVTPRGTLGMYHVTHHQLGDQSFNELMAEACENLTTDLRVNGHQTDDGQLLSMSGTLVSAMVCLPDFYHRVAELAGATRLVVGLPGPDEVYVAAAGTPLADAIHRMVHESEYPITELVPCVLAIEGDHIEVLSERGLTER